MSAPSFMLPLCRFCERPWKPPPGVDASMAYCKVCSPERRAIAAERLGARPITMDDVEGKYIRIKRRPGP